ncbi:MAG: GspE family protein, partial [Lactobacillus sp.]|nr:GspE family protein [Lactobacillus sp.]
MTSVNDTLFWDIYITNEKIAYIPDNKTAHGLEILQADDFDEYFDFMEKAWDGKNPSYSILYKGRLYRVERTVGVYGIQYAARKMPLEIPSFASLGFDRNLTEFLLSLNSASGLILWSGPTGAGKTTSISSLLKEFLNYQGGYAYTIEDPAEMPLDGLYKSVYGGLGLCKQSLPPEGDWGGGLKSALRSKPRYILVGEIRTPETASEVLRAATSGHLVLSSVHANNIADAINSVVKYASSTSMSEELAYDLFSRGMLGVLHQTLSGTRDKKPTTTFLFANPD